MDRSRDAVLSIKFRVDKLKKRIEEIGKFIYTGVESLLPVQYKVTSPGIYSPAAVPPGGWMPIEGPDLPSMEEDALCWFRRRFNVTDITPKEDLILFLRFANQKPGEEAEPVEGLVVIDGKVLQGFDSQHRDVFLPTLSPDVDHELTLRVDFNKNHKFRKIINLEMRRVHRASWKMYLKLKYLLEAYKVCSDDSPAAFALLDFIEKIIAEIPFTDPGSKEYYEALDSVFESFEIPAEFADSIGANALATGHAHIDVAWLWPLEETRRKSVHTFSTVLRLMDQYDEFTFFQSQPQLYEFVRERQPALFEKIGERAAEGRWLTDGAGWVEFDCSIPDGESLVRQLVYGKRYFKDNFGFDSRILWLPDTFGFNANLPSIMKGAGVDYFITSKISWSSYTRFPYDTFRWRGIDGSEVLAHFMTAHNWKTGWAATYNAMLTPLELKGAWDSYAQKDKAPEIVVSFGFGDGGGGPTPEMLERLPLLEKLPGLPSVRTGHPFESFKKYEEKRESLPAWRGELYLEYHRGTLTSRGMIKKMIRRCERALNRLEKAVAIDMTGRNRSIKPDERKEINELWKLFLLNQFHDIIAGSSIHSVNVEAVEQLTGIAEKAEKMAAELLKPWACKWAEEKGLTEGSVVGFNHNDALASTAKYDEKEEKTLVTYHYPFSFYNEDTPADVGETIEVEGLKYEAGSVESAFYKISLNDKGEIVSYNDKSQLDDFNVIKEGRVLNDLEFYEDRPMNWDAWDIDEFYKNSPLEKAEVVSAEWIEKGPVKGIFRCEMTFRDSKITQDTIFDVNTPRIDFKTTVDWHNKNVLIKAAFPFHINADRACYEIPFGYVTRPTHKNRPADRAMFEVAGQRWAAVFEKDRGMALLNDGKYGYSSEEGTLSLSLMKSAVYPDPDAEEGLHEFTYSLYPLGMSTPTSDLIDEALNLNNPPVEFKYEKSADSIGKDAKFPRFTIRSGGQFARISSIKPSDEDEKAVTIRVYDALNCRGRAILTVPKNVKSAALVDFLEKKTGDLPLERTEDGVEIELNFKPFEIKTVKLYF